MPCMAAARPSNRRQTVGQMLLARYVVHAYPLSHAPLILRECRFSGVTRLAISGGGVAYSMMSTFFGANSCNTVCSSATTVAASPSRSSLGRAALT